MVNFVDRLNETRDQWLQRGNEIWAELQTRGNGIVIDLNERRGRLLETSHKALTSFETGVLTQASSLLGWAYGVTGERSDVLKRSRDFILDRLAGEEEVEAPKVNAAPTAPFDGYDELNVKNISSKMTSMSAAELKAVRAYEAANKGRKTVVGFADKLLDEMG